MLSDPKAAEQKIRRDIGIMRQQKANLERQRDQANQQIAQLSAAIEEWSSVLADDPQPEAATPEA